MTTRTKRFDGVIYKFYDVFSRKSDALKVAREKRQRGYDARVFTRKRKRSTSYEVFTR